MLRSSNGRFAPLDEPDGCTLPGEVQNGRAAESVTSAWQETHHGSHASSAPVDTNKPPQAANARSTEDHAQLSKRTAFMPDAEHMKEQMREQTCKPKYDVAMYYHKTGFTQWIARHPRFEQLTLTVIELNAIWIWIDTDHNPGAMLLSSPPFFQIVEHFFCMYFTFEWAMRFSAFKHKWQGLRDGWFVFDSFLVGTMVFETWLMTAVVVFASKGNNGGMGNTSILRIARLLRLTRMARMARLLRAMPELQILVKGMLAAMRSVGFTLGLLFVMLYVFGIAFVQLCNDTPCESFFPDVPVAMHELLLNAALMDGLANLVLPLKEQSLILLFVLYAFIFISALTVMNMLIGVICEVVSAVAATERESLSLAFVHEKIQELLCEAGADQDNDNLISKEEFMQLLKNPQAIAILQDVGVDVVGLVDVKDTLFETDGKTEDDDAAEPADKKLTIPELMGLVLDLRGGNSATVRDLVNLRKHLTGKLSAIEQKLARLSKRHGPLYAMGVSSRPSLSPNGTFEGGLEDHDAESTYDSVKYCPSARLGSSPSFLEMFHRLRGLMSAHEVEMAAVETENRQLKDQLAQLASNACRSLSKARASCMELDAMTPTVPLVISPCGKDNIIQPPKEFAAGLRTISSLRAAADGAAAGSMGHYVDVDAGNTAWGADMALSTSATFTSQNDLASQPSLPQSPTRGPHSFSRSGCSIISR